MEADEKVSEVTPKKGKSTPKTPKLDPAKPTSSPKPGMLTIQQYKDRLWRRFYRTLDYASIAFSMLVIYGAWLIADYLLLILIEYLFRSELIESTSLAASIFKDVKIGLALLTFILALIHGVRSAWEQSKLDSLLAKEDEKPHV